MAEESQVPDMDAVNGFIAQRVAEEHAKLLEVEKARVPPVDADRQLQQQMQQTLDPFTRPIAMLAADAKDHSSFYTRNADMLDQHDEIEKLFDESMRTGRNLGRQDIADYLDGKQRRTDNKTWQERQAAKETAVKQKETANSAVDIGFSAMDKAKNDPSWTNFASKTIEEMESALDGIAF